MPHKYQEINVSWLCKTNESLQYMFIPKWHVLSCKMYSCKVICTSYELRTSLTNQWTSLSIVSSWVSISLIHPSWGTGSCSPFLRLHVRLHNIAQSRTFFLENNFCSWLTLFAFDIVKTFHAGRKKENYLKCVNEIKANKKKVPYIG